MEMEFPVRIEGYEIIADSGGPGKHRGGTGVRRDLRGLAAASVQHAGSSGGWQRRAEHEAVGVEDGSGGIVDVAVAVAIAVKRDLGSIR